jgi:chemotaxis protein methyltransferase CheR
MVSDLTEDEYNLFRHLIKKHAGLSFSRQKITSLQRKLINRMGNLELESYGAYYRYLLHHKEGKKELQGLINNITIQQTGFFRHRHQFELLTSVILPQLLVTNKKTRKLRIWSAGCSTGQEIYSIGMALSEMFEDEGNWDAKILGTDIDTDALKVAYSGQYSKDSLSDVPAEYVEKYFDKCEGCKTEHYAVKESLKEKVLFRRLNFMEKRFPFKNRVDILFCRNVMIYFDSSDKRRLIDHFFHILTREGFLFLGASESLIGIDKRFALVGHSIYQKTE